jgi:glutathione peroxidase
MNIVRSWLRRVAGATQAFARAFDSKQPRRRLRAGTTVAILAVLVGAAATWRFSADALLDAARLLAYDSSDVAQDDGAGDVSPSSTDAERYLPVPSPLDDERVLAALGPIANLSCKKADYATQATASPPASDLGPPLADTSTTAWIDRSAAASPDALSAPLSSPRFDVDDLMTRNLLAAGLSPIAALPAPDAVDCPALLRHTFNKLQTGEPQSLCQFQGKVLLIVNTASYCAYTKQYESLEAMYRKYRDRGFVVVGFPSNDFGKQEPGSNQEIAEFCRTTYGVQFPMFEKSSVAKLTANPLYAQLAAKTGATPKWNFHKYVVDRNGTPIASFASDVTPDSPKLVELIERLLAEKYASKG